MTSSDGWSVITPVNPVYVAANGKDSNPGTEAAPLLTPKAGLDRLNQSKADAVLFRRGDVFNMGTTGMFLSRSGTQPRPVVIASYGTGERPLFTTSVTGIQINFNGIVSHYVISGLHLKATAMGSFGIRNVGGGEDALIEDCFIEGFFDDIGFDPQPTYGGFKNLKVRRNIITDATGADAGKFSQGIYVASTDGILLEENFFDQNGLNGPNKDIRTIFNHHVYFQTTNTPNIIVRNNIFTRGLDGVQVRPGGTVDGNLLAWNSISITMRQSRGVISNNVVLDGTDITPDLARAFGIYMDVTMAQNPGNVLSIKDNLFARDHSAKTYQAVMVLNSNPGKITVTGTTVSAWRGGFNTKGSPNVKADSPIAGPFVDASRGVESYIGTLGKPATIDSFVAEEKLQSKTNWRTSLMAKSINAWITAGFQAKK